MKTAFAFILFTFTFLLNTPCLAQEAYKQHIDSLLNGTWKADSSNEVLRFDCHRKDTLVAYGILDPKMKWFVAFKLITKCHLPCDCMIPDSGSFFMGEINYTNYPGKASRLGYDFRIMNISEKRLVLYIMWKQRMYHCKFVSYTKAE